MAQTLRQLAKEQASVVNDTQVVQFYKDHPGTGQSRRRYYRQTTATDTQQY